MAIKPSGVPYDELTPESIVVVDLETGGSSTASSGRRPTRRRTSSLYRRFESVGGIVHTHSPSATRVGAGRPRRSRCFGTTHADHFRGAVPVTRDARRDEEIEGDYEERTGDVIVETLERRGLDPLDMPAVLVASHGPFTWGATRREAVENAVALEVVATHGDRHRSCASHPSRVDRRRLLDEAFPAQARPGCLLRAGRAR